MPFSCVDTIRPFSLAWKATVRHAGVASSQTDPHYEEWDCLATSLNLKCYECRLFGANELS